MSHVVGTGVRNLSALVIFCTLSMFALAADPSFAERSSAERGSAEHSSVEPVSAERVSTDSVSADSASVASVAEIQRPTFSSSNYVAPNLMAIIAQTKEEPKPRRVADTKFITMSAVSMGVTIADIERTQHCLAKQSCVELNPLLPHSRAGMYAVNVPLNAGLMYLSYRLKASGRKTWWLAPLGISAGHLVGATFKF